VSVGSLVSVRSGQVGDSAKVNTDLVWDGCGWKRTERQETYDVMIARVGLGWTRLKLRA
jgi:hypothetical protein